MKKKCEICGNMKPQNEFSKSYKNRCKACVAELTRIQRQACSGTTGITGIQYHPAREYPEGECGITTPQDTYGNNLPASLTTPAYNLTPRATIATACLQGLLAAGYIPELNSNLAKEAVRLADMLIMELDNPPKAPVKPVMVDISSIDRQMEMRKKKSQEDKDKSESADSLIHRMGYDPDKVTLAQALNPRWRENNPPTQINKPEL